MSKSAKKTENIEISDGEPKGDSKVDPIQLLLKKMQDMENANEKLNNANEKLNKVVAYLVEKDAETMRNSPKKEIPNTGIPNDVLDITPPSDKTHP